MKYIALFEDFKNNNQDGDLITIDDILNCIKSNGVVYATIIKDFPENDPKVPLKPTSVDEDGLVTVDYEGIDYEVELKHIEKIEDSSNPVEENPDDYTF